MTEEVTLAILAGGESGRMGKDKGLMPFLGRPLIQRIYERLSGLGKEIILSTNHPQDYYFLGIKAYTDLIPGCGALGGLYTILSVIKTPMAAITGCDMPFANRLLFDHELEILDGSKAAAVIPSTADGLEPLHAVYRKADCLGAIRSALEAGSYKMTGWLQKVEYKILQPEEWKRFDPEGLAFRNINTQAEFEQVEGLARNIERN